MLLGPPFPVTMAEAWVLFDELSLSRGGAGFGPAPLPPSEVLAWQTLTGMTLAPWHVAAIRALDVTFLGTMSVEDQALDFAALADADT